MKILLAFLLLLLPVPAFAASQCDNLPTAQARVKCQADAGYARATPEQKRRLDEQKAVMQPVKPWLPTRPGMKK